ncbi:MAG: M16 family metallopeptidase [Hyphomicrobiaceae bacterium]
MSLSPQSAVAEGYSPKVEKLTTPGGIKVWLTEEHAIPLIAFRFAFKGGALQDPDGRTGLTQTMTSLLGEGAGDLDSSAFAREMADIGAKLDFSTARDQVYGGLDVLPKHLEKASQLVRLALSAPRFDQDAIDRVKAQSLADLEMMEGNPRSEVFHNWYKTTFPAQRYGRRTKGTSDSVRAITRDELVKQHKRLIARDVLRVVVVGDITADAVKTAVDKLFAELPEKATLDEVAPAKMKHVAEVQVLEQNQPLATAAFGGTSVPPGDPDFAAMEIINQILGSGDFNSILMDEIRVKRGLAYSVSLSTIDDSVASIVLGGMSTKNENMMPALDVLKKSLAKFNEQGPTQAQFDNARKYLTGSYLLDFDTNSKLASSLLTLWIEGRQPEYIGRRNAEIDAVKIDDMKRVGHRVLDPEKINISVVGKLPK